MDHLISKTIVPARPFTVPGFDNARVKDRLSRKESSQVLLDEMLADPMVQLVMRADKVSETQLRYLYSGSRTPQTDVDVLDRKTDDDTRQGLSPDRSVIQIAENEGMPSRPGTSPLSE